MDESLEPRRKRTNRVRERHLRRQDRSMAKRHADRQSAPALRLNVPPFLEPLAEGVLLRLQDGWWYLRHTPVLLIGLVAAVAVYLLLFSVSYLTQSRIFPNVWAFGVPIGDMTEEEASTALLNAWNNDVRIRLTDGERTWDATTDELGLKLKLKPVIESARGVGMAGIPMGIGVDPAVDVDYITTQNYFLDLSQQVQLPPYNAGYEVQANQVVGIPGKEGRVLDVGQTIEHLQQDVVTVVRRRRLDLIMQPLLPDFTDPDPFLPQAQRVIGQSLLLSGYDPYTNETINWSTSPDSLASWLEASPSGLTLREDAYLPFLDAQTASLNPNGDNLRFLEPGETMDAIRGAIARNEPSVRLRIRYRPTVYEVESGDRATAVARRNGIPYFLVEEANPGRDLNVLSVGDKINLPSRDVAVPLPPIPNKRIVVDISTQHLVAYENGQMIYDWDVSTGISSAPTAPGVYQILTHNDLAYGSTFSLCGSAGCGQWTMHWFMGIYEVTNGLMNGLHGAVELPDGRYLGGGNVGHPYTYGCVMSLDSNAKELYDWADEGTLVEIISNEYPPQSDLARQVAAADHLATT